MKHQNSTIQNLFKLYQHKNIEFTVVNKDKVAVVIQPTYAISNCEGNTALDKYVRSISAMNKKTAHEYYFRLLSFQQFVNNAYKAEIKTNNKTESALIARMHEIERKQQPYVS